MVVVFLKEVAKAVDDEFHLVDFGKGTRNIGVIGVCLVSLRGDQSLGESLPTLWGSRKRKQVRCELPDVGRLEAAPPVFRSRDGILKTETICLSLDVMIGVIIFIMRHARTMK